MGQNLGNRIPILIWKSLQESDGSTLGMPVWDCVEFQHGHAMSRDHVEFIMVTPIFFVVLPRSRHVAWPCQHNKKNILKNE